MNTSPSKTSMRPIIVGVDGSEQSKVALNWAVHNAGDGQPIHAVHAFSPVAELALAAVQQDWTAQRQHRARELDKSWVADARKHGTVPYTSIVDDDPAGALLSKATTCDGSMIVVGPHGDGNSRSLGRVTRSLLHALPVPVVVARPGGAPDVYDAGRVVVAVGYGETASAAVDWAADYANRHGHSIELLHVVGYRPLIPFDSPTDMLASYFGGSTPTDWATIQLQEHAENIARRYPDLDVACVVERGSVVHRTLDRSVGAKLLVLGQGRFESATRNVYASRTLGIVSQTETSAVIVPT